MKLLLDDKATRGHGLTAHRTVGEGDTRIRCGRNGRREAQMGRLAETAARSERLVKVIDQAPAKEKRTKRENHAGGNNIS